MPHNHKRKRDGDESNFDLPPSARARTLSVHQKSESIFTSDKERKEQVAAKRQQRKKNKGSGSRLEDDTPKAFARLMAFQREGKRLPSGLDDGVKAKKGKGKNQKKTAAKAPDVKATENEDTAVEAAEEEAQLDSAPTASAKPALQIQPGERLADFSLRVDQSMPLSGVPKHTTRGGNVPGLDIKTPLTKHNKRLARMQRDWRTQDAKIRDRREEEAEDMAEKKEEDSLLWLGVDANGGKSGTKGKKKKKRDLEDEVDPWKVLERKRREQERAADAAGGGASAGSHGGGGGSTASRSGQTRGLNARDAAQAPPVLKPLKNIFKEKPERGPVGYRDPRVLERTVLT